MSKIAKKIEWLVLIYDKQPINPRLAFRAEHLRKVPEKVEAGQITSCGPIFEDESKTRFLGSSFTISAESKPEVLRILQNDIYTKEGVWDFNKVVIHPYTPFYRKGHELPK